MSLMQSKIIKVHVVRQAAAAKKNMQMKYTLTLETSWEYLLS